MTEEVLKTVILVGGSVLTAGIGAWALLRSKDKEKETKGAPSERQVVIDASSGSIERRFPRGGPADERATGTVVARAAARFEQEWGARPQSIDLRSEGQRTRDEEQAGWRSFDARTDEERARAMAARVYLPERSLSEVYAAVNAIKRPLLREETLKRGYVGRWAKWSGSVETVQRRESGGFALMVTAGRDIVHLSLPESEHATVDSLMEHDVVDYEGLIESIDLLAALSDVHILSVKRPGEESKG